MHGVIGGWKGDLSVDRFSDKNSIMQYVLSDIIFSAISVLLLPVPVACYVVPKTEPYLNHPFTAVSHPTS